MDQIIFNAKLTQLVKKPTRITSCSATLIDIILTNRPDLAVCHDVIPCPVGDHELITVTLNISKPKSQPTMKTFRQLKNYSPDTLCNLLILQSHERNKIFAADNVDDQATIFNEIFHQCFTNVHRW